MAAASSTAAALKRAGFTQLGEGSSSDAAQRALKAAQAASRRVAVLIQLADFRNLDIFGYYPLYSFPGYRSRTGAWMSAILAVGVALRVVTTLADFASPWQAINEQLKKLGEQPLSDVEFVALRLYTGPMFVKCTRARDGCATCGRRGRRAAAALPLCSAPVSTSPPHS